MSEKRYAPPSKIPELYPGAFTKASIRYCILKRKENGLDSCLRRVGKKILFDLDGFEKWIDSRKDKDWQ